jgi:hypothetical protein
MSKPTPLLAVPARIRQDIELFHRDGEVLSDPHIVEVYLVSRSRSDISRDSFDGGKPLILDLGSPIIALASETVEPFAGPTVFVGPRLIRKREVVTFTALIDGAGATLTCRNPPANVALRKDARSIRCRWAGLTILSQASTLIFATCILVGTVSIVAGLTLRYTRSSLTAILLALVASIIGGTLLASLARAVAGLRRTLITPLLSSVAFLFVVGVVVAGSIYGIQGASTTQIVDPVDGGKVGYLQDIRLKVLDARPGQTVWVLVSSIGSQRTYPQGPCDPQQATDEYLCPRTEFGAPSTNGVQYKFYLQGVLVGPAIYNELRKHVGTGLQTTPKVAVASPIITVHR